MNNHGSTIKDRLQYGYDRNSSRTYKQNTQASTMSELYGYDNLNPLTAMDRGTLNANKDGITGTAAREEDWTLDPTGNWTGYLTKTTGTTDLDQTRSHNKANEIDTDNNHANTPGNAISGTPNWSDPAYDAAGNMTTLPKPSPCYNARRCLCSSPRFARCMSWRPR